MTSRSKDSSKQKHRSVDTLWTTLCQTIGNHTAVLGVAGRGSECSYCNDLYSCNGLLLKCIHRGCKKYVHPTCAYDIGSLSESDAQEGEANSPVLVARCEEHVRKLVYCICKSTYDEGAALIGCDSCKEWYHFTCLGLDPYQEYEEFICDACKENSQSWIEETRIKNEKKDELHEANERAENGVKMICTFGDDVCPIVDSLSAAKKVSPTDVDKALNTISAFEEDRYFDYDSIQTRFGVHSIISSWKNLLMDVNKHVKQLSKKINENCKSMANYTDAFRMATSESLMLTKSYREMNRELQKIQDEWNSVQSEISNCAVREFEGDPFQKVLSKTFEYFALYFETFNEDVDVSSDEALASTFKKMDGYIEEGRLLLKRNYLYTENANADLRQSITDLIEGLERALDMDNSWAEKAVDTIQAAAPISDKTLHNMVSSKAESYLSNSGLYRSLLQLQEKSKALDNELETFFNCSEEITFTNLFDMFIALSDKVKKTQVRSSCVETFSYMAPIIATIKNWDSLSASRWCYWQIMELKNSSMHLLTQISNRSDEDEVFRNYSILSVFERFLEGYEACFEDELVQYSPVIDACKTDIDQHREWIDTYTSPSDFSMADIDMLTNHLTELRKLSFISNEESLVNLLVTSIPLLNSVKTIDAPAQIMDLKDTSILLESVRTALQAFSRSQPLKIPKIVDTLSNELNTTNSHSLANKIDSTRTTWEALYKMSTSTNFNTEEYFSRFREAERLNIRDTRVYDLCLSLNEEKDAVESKFYSEMNEVKDISERSLNVVEGIVKKCRRLPVDTSMKKAAERRFSVVQVCLKCQQLLRNKDDPSLEDSFDTETKRLENFENEEIKADLDEIESIMLTQTIPPFKQAAFIMFMKGAVARKREISEIERKLASMNAWSFVLSTETLEIKSKAEAMVSNANNVKIRLSECKEKYTRIGSDSMEVSDTTLSATTLQWHHSYQELYQEFKTIHAELANLEGVTLHSQNEEVDKYLSIMHIITIATITLMGMQATVSEEGKTSSTIDVTLAPRQSILLSELESTTSDMKEVAALDENLCVLSKISSLLDTFLTQANSWQEENMHLVGVKNMRRKKDKAGSQPVESHTADELVTALSNPIVRAVVIPCAVTMRLTLVDVRRINTDLTEFLLPTKPSTNDEAATVRSAGVTLWNMQQQMDVMRVAMPERVLVDWAAKVVEWISTEPYYNVNLLKEDELELSEAREILERVKPFVSSIPSGVLEWLKEMGVITGNDSDGSVVFSSESNKVFNILVQIVNLLKSEIQRTVEWEQQNAAAELLTLGDGGKFMRKSPADSGLVILPKSVQDSSVSSQNIKKPKKKKETDDSKAGFKRKVDSDYFHTSKYNDSSSDDGDNDDDEYEYDHDRSSKDDKVRHKEVKILERQLKKKRSKEKKVTKSQASSVLMNLPSLSQKTIPVNKRLCAANRCVWDIVDGSSYCSDTCALKTCSSIISQLMASKKMLNKSLLAKAGATYDKNPDLASFRPKDFDADDSIAKIKEVLIKRNIIDESKISKDKGDKTNITGMVNKKRTHALLLGAASAVASSFMRGVDEMEKSATTDQMKLLSEMRAKVANSMEEVFIASLTRIGYPDPSVFASILSTEIEEKLYRKYKSFKITDDIKNQYKRHQLTLVQNFKATHNDHHIGKLVTGVLDAESLLEFTPEQFTDPKLIARHKALKDKEHREANLASLKTPEELKAEEEARKRKVCEEAEEDANIDETGDSDEIAVDAKPLPESIPPASNSPALKKAKTAYPGSQSAPKHREIDHRPYKYIGDEKFAELQEEKRRKAEEEDEALEEAIKPPKPVEKVKQGVDVLSLLRAVSTNMDTNPSSSFSQSLARPVNLPVNLYQNKSNMDEFVPIISASGICRFQISENVSGMRLDTICFTKDKRVQGIIPSDIGVKGRLGIKPMNEFVSDCMKSNRRIVAPISILSYHSANSAYSKYSKDLEIAAKPIGVFEIKSPENHILLYVIPNSLVDRIEMGTLVFPDVDLTEKGFQRVFAGVLVTKKVGPVKYVQAPPRELIFNEDGSIQSTEEIEKIETDKKAAEELANKESAMLEVKEKEDCSEKKTDEDELQKLESEMAKVIRFIIEHGDNMLDKMRAAAGAETSTPYLFEGNDGYENFMARLEAEKRRDEKTTNILSATGLGDDVESESDEEENSEAAENESSSKLKESKRKAGRGKALPRKK